MIRVLILTLFIFIIQQLSANNDTLAAWNKYKTAKKLSLKGNYAEASKLFSETAFLLKNSSSCLYAFSIYSLSDIYKTNGDLSNSLKTIKSTDLLQLKKTSIELLLLIEYQNRLGSLLFLSGQTEDALKIFESAIQKIASIEKKHPHTAYKIFNNYGSVLEAKNQYNQALLYYLKANILATRISKKDISQAYLNQNIAKMYLFLGNTDSSRFYFNNSISISQNLLALNEIQLGLFYQNTGLFYKNLGMFENAIEYYQKAENILTKKLAGNDHRLDALYSNMGSIFLLQGDYEHAIEYFNNSYLIFLQNKSTDLNKKIILLKNLANVYFYTSNFQKTYELIQEILIISKKIPIELKIEIPYSFIAKFFTRAQKHELAEKYYTLNLEQTKKFYGEKSPAYASALMNLGQYYLTLKRFNESQNFLFKANQLFIAFYGNDHKLNSQSIMALGNYYLATENEPIAIQKYIQALKLLEIQIDNIESVRNFIYQSNGYEISALNLLRKLGFTYIRLAEKEKNPLKTYEKALKCFEAAITFVKLLQSGYLNEESKLFIVADQQNILSKAILVALQLYKLSSNKKYLIKAYEFVEKSKSVVLLSSLRDMEAKIFSNIPNKLMQQEKQANEDIAILREMIVKEQQKQSPDPIMIEKWQKKVFELIKLKESLIAEYKKKYPAYYNSKFESDIISVKNIQKKLKRKEILIEYFFSDTSLISFCISKQSIQHQAIKTDSSFFAEMEWLISFLNKGAFSEDINQIFSSFNTISNKFFVQLLGSFQSQLNKRRIIIIPDNLLAFLPFEILITEKSKKLKPDYRQMKYLIRNNIIRYAYSASLIFNSNKSKRKPNNKILAIAPKYGNFNNLVPERELAIREYKNILIPLKGVEKEVNFIKEKTKAKVLIANSATEKNFKELAPDYGILHLAMHTIIDNEKPLYSKLVFSLNNDSSEDGLLNTYELYNLNLNAKLTILSACNTGFGRLQKGEGVMSLARGFIYAGCPNIIMTLWALEDKAGLTVMSEFYNYLRKGVKTDKALTYAKLEYLKNADNLKSHPYFWAGYVSIGSYTAFNRLLVQFSIIAIFILTIGIGTLLFIKRKKRFI